MDGFAKIEKNIMNGLVLDESGNWIPLSEKIRQEKEFLQHLQNGHVYIDKSWMTIEQRKAMQETSNVSVQQPLSPSNYDDTYPQQTAPMPAKPDSHPENQDESLTVSGVRNILDQNSGHHEYNTEERISNAPNATQAAAKQEGWMEWENAQKKGSFYKISIIIFLCLAIIAALIGYFIF
ncbi:MAG: hypothetical protein GF401_20780 [Chitinivibrionales bacterium]|nr:hypothetical protein [Chitinivibrionales bacterium]